MWRYGPKVGDDTGARFLMTVGLSIAAIGPVTLEDMRSLLGREPEDWCWCVAWEVRTWDGWTERKAEENRSLREALWAARQYHGFLFYRDGQPIGWCRVGPPAAWPKLCQTRGLDPEEEAYVLTCFGLRPEWRGKELMHRFLALVIDALRRAGVKELIALPKDLPEGADAGAVWNGPRRLYKKAGFRPHRQGEGFTEMRLRLD